MSEGIDFSRTYGSRECSICHYRYFLKIYFRFHRVCDGCPDLMQKAMRFIDVTIASVKGNGYRYRSRKVIKKC